MSGFYTYPGLTSIQGGVCVLRSRRAHTRKEGGILGTAPLTVIVQIQPSPSPAIPPWMGEVAAFAHVLTHTGMLKTSQEQVRFARARFGQYDLIDFVAVLIGYVLSGEPTLLAFYERLTPWADAFMALFGRDRLPHRSTLSRFLATLDQNTVEALRTRLQDDGLARSLSFPWWPVRPDRRAVAGHRRGWNPTNGSSTSTAANGRVACSPS